MGLVPTRQKFILPTNDIPDFNQEENNGYLHEDLLNELDFKVANIANYFGHQEKLVEAIRKCRPDVILLGWCYSLNSDVAQLFRGRGIFSEMILNHDLRRITGRATAELNPQQRKLISDIGNAST